MKTRFIELAVISIAALGMILAGIYGTTGKVVALCVAVSPWAC